MVDRTRRTARRIRMRIIGCEEDALHCIAFARQSIAASAHGAHFERGERALEFIGSPRRDGELVV